MDRRSFIKTSGIVTAYAAVLSNKTIAEQPQQQPQPQINQIVNPFEQEGNWYKAALHVHTTTSDGDVDVATRIGEYRNLGYDVVAITDHWKTNELSSFTDEKFLAISGMEAHPKTATGAPAHHFVCLDLPHPFELSKDLPAQELIDKVVSAGGKVIYAHPYWTQHTLEEMLEVTGYIGVEVFNGVCDLEAAKGFGNVHWDQMLNKGHILTGIATDDVHSSRNINLGWTMIKAKGLNLTDIMDAFSKGCYYSSTGPVIEDIRMEDGTITLKSSPASKIRFLFAGSGGGRTFYAEQGKTITEAKWKFSDNKRPCKWIRAEVIDENGKSAWANPMVIAEKA